MLESKVDNLIKKHPERKLFKVKSYSRPEEYHLVGLDHRGKWRCSCEYQQIYTSKACTHIARITKKCRLCGEETAAKGLCRKHYNEKYRNTHKRKIKNYRKARKNADN